MYLDAGNERANARDALRAKGMAAFLPRESKFIELAAKLSLLSNAAVRLEDYAKFLAMNLGEGLDFDFKAFLADTEILFAADPGRVIFHRGEHGLDWAV
jgi:hypothetical protein